MSCSCLPEQEREAIAKSEGGIVTYKAQLSVGLHILVMMGTFFAAGYMGVSYLSKDPMHVRLSVSRSLSYFTLSICFSHTQGGCSVTFTVNIPPADIGMRHRSIILCFSVLYSLNDVCTVQHVVGGLVGLIFAMLMETLLLIIRTTVPPTLPVEEALRNKQRPQGVAAAEQHARPDDKKEQ